MLRLTYIILFSFFIFNNVMYAQVFHIVKTSIDENMVYTMQDNNLQHYITTSIKYTNPLDFTSEKLSPQIKLTGGSGFSIGYVLNYNFKGKIDLTFGYLKLKLSWDTICNITGLSYYCQNEGYNINDSEVFSINIDLAKELNLI